MSVTISITTDDIDAALRAFLLTLVPAGVEVVRAQDNRVPQPIGPNYILFTPRNRAPFATTKIDWDKTDPAAVILDRIQSVEVTYQLDYYGPNSGDYAQIVSVLTRDFYGAENFNNVVPIQPLYTTEARQLPLVNEEKQFEERWTQDFVMQIVPTVSTSGEFASIVEIVLKPIGG